jgi:thiamine biosynthesis protein ThiS
MNIIVNGDVQQVAQHITLIDFLQSISQPTTNIAIEVNNEIVPRSLYEEFILHNNDKIEIIKAVGGG